MLLSLRIENFAIISSTQVDFSPGFNVLTGETGAGKSILMEALGLILGNRAQKSMIRQGSEKSEIEAVFTSDNPKLKEILEENGFDHEELLIIQKNIYLDRPSISRLNGKSISNSVLGKITSILADSTHQQENQKLLNSKTQIDLLDQFIGEKQKDLLLEIGKIVDLYRKEKSFLEEENQDELARNREMDLLRFQVEEIREADLLEGEDIRLEEEEKKAKAFSKINEVLYSLQTTAEGEEGLRSLIERFSYDINSISNFDTTYLDLSKRIEGLKYEWFDIFSDLRNLSESMEFDEARFIEIENRLDQINRLKRKYGTSIKEIHDKLREMEDRLSFLENFEDQMKEHKKKLADLEEVAKSISLKLRENRKEMAMTLEKKMVKELSELNIPRAEFYVEFEEADLSKRGMDRINYLISTNVGEEAKPMDQVASGGEMSRILLAFKSIMAMYDETETLIFDEIDAGMGGKTAKIVGDKMSKLSEKAQLIVISHLPQVVAQADVQFQIQKEEVGQRTRSILKKLTHSERVDYLATMISGSDQEIALETAKSMLRDKQ